MHLEDTRVRRFKVLAEAYCSLVESAETAGRGQLLRRLSRHLSALYAAATDLPDDIELGDEPETDPPSVADRPSPWLARKFGDVDAYAFVFDPWNESERTPVIGSLSDDVADVYQDLKEGLDALAAGAPPGDVIWEWRFSFEKHWGVHAAHALYAIHWVTHNGDAQWVAPDDP